MQKGNLLLNISRKCACKVLEMISESIILNIKLSQSLYSDLNRIIVQNSGETIVPAIIIFKKKQLVYISIYIKQNYSN